MDRAFFTYKGIDSRDMHIYIENDIAFPSPEADIELVEVVGRDGEVAIDNKRLKGANFPIPIKLRMPPSKRVNEVATDISNWLKSDIGWHALRFSGSEEYEYIAMSYEQFDIQETLKNYGRTVITFRLKPYKRRVDSMPVMARSGQTILNTGTRPSRPLIKIKGSGSVTVRNNGNEWLRLKDIDQEITVDSELMSAYKGNMPQYDKMLDIGQFPTLEVGSNTIQWTGAITSMEIDPRWEVIV